MSTDIDRLRKALEDRYALERELGEGGMATVYLAQDLKHNRKVAVKVLRPELAAVVGAERFLSEIETTANLQHPHILPLFDSGAADGFLYYVMPYVEGESLRERLEREHQLSVDEAVEITRKVAAALHYAHENNVVHRDVKPANILMSRGEPLVADFGIALALTEAGGGRITETGLSLGTPHYMSPEQAAGERSLDVRSDVYALGCILYEMLTGEPPHGGPTPQAVLAKILTDNPRRITELRRTVPTHVDAAAAKALEKLPADRFHTAEEFARALAQAGFTYEMTVGARVAPSRTDARTWKIAAGALGAAAVLLGASTLILALRSPAEDSTDVLRFQLPLPIGAGAASDFGPNVTISPDGRTVVYSGLARESSTASLWVRRWDKIEPEELLGTDAGVHPTFSPDGSRVAFITDNRELKVVSLEGRPPVTLHESGGLRRAGLAWGDDGFIYFSQLGGAGAEGSEGRDGIYRIPENGGEMEQVTAVDTARGEIRHYFPDYISGEGLLVLASASNDQYSAADREIAVADIETGEVRRVLQGIQAWWSPTGHILSVRSDGALLAATFDPKTFEVGPANPVFEGVQIEPQASVDLAVSDNGTLIYVPGNVSGQESRTAVWVNRNGAATPVDPAWRGRYQEPRISPDGTKLAVRIREGNGGEHVWVKELDTGPAARLTFEGNSERPTWHPEGDQVAFISQRNGSNQDVMLRRSDAATAARLLADADENIEQVEFSPDGAWMVVRIVEDLYVMSTEPDAEPEPLLADPDVLEANFDLSPDGRWIAYTSNETGAQNVYVRPFPNVSDGKWPVSTQPAVSPRWSPDGREIFYKGFDGQLMSARVLEGSTFVLGERRPLFPHRPYFADVRHAQYDVHPDGDRFIMIQLSDTNLEKPLVVVENFTREIQGGARR